MTKKDTIRLVVFLLIFLIVFVYLNKAFSMADSDENSQIVNGFYAEKENSLDGVYLGASAVNRFWNGPRAYEKYGMAIFGFSTSSQPIALYRNLIEEAEKTQDPKLYIIELRDVTQDVERITEEGIRRVTDNMKFSLNRFNTINTALEFAAKGKNDDIDRNKLDYYFPILKYHGRWQADDLSSKDLLLKNSTDHTKGFLLGKKSCKQAAQEETVYTLETAPLTKEIETVLDDLLSYCHTLDAEVLFVMSPYSEQKTVEVGRMNQAVAMVEDSGYTVLNFNTQNMIQDVGIDWEKDYYDDKHVNILGSEKYTDYLAEYISEHYELEDHRGQADYKSWDEAYDYYLDFTAQGRLTMQE